MNHAALPCQKTRSPVTMGIRPYLLLVQRPLEGEFTQCLPTAFQLPAALCMDIDTGYLSLSLRFAFVMLFSIIPISNWFVNSFFIISSKILNFPVPIPSSSLIFPSALLPNPIEKTGRRRQSAACIFSSFVTRKCPFPGKLR